LEEGEEAYSKKTEEIILRNEKELNAMHENVPVFLLLMDEEQLIVKANKVVFDFAHHTIKEIMGVRGGEALRCLYSLDNTKGCGFGPNCKICGVRNTVLDTFKTGKPHYLAEAALPFKIDGKMTILDLSVNTVPLEVMGKRLVLVSIDNITKLKEAERELIQNKDILKERLKELSCLTKLSSLTTQTGITLDKFFRETVKLMQPSWQYPEITRSRIISGTKKYKSRDFKVTKWKQSSDIIVEGKRLGAVEVYYLKKMPEIEEGPFLKEERDLINSITEIIEGFIKRKKAENELKNSYEKSQRALSDTINSLASIVEILDPYTAGHQKNIALLAISIAEELGLDKDKIEAIGTAARIHDIGKINIPPSILARPGKISDIEYSIIKTHSQLGHDMIRNIEFQEPIAFMVLQHHVRPDGSGYPKGLKGKNIMLEAKIIAVADVVEAMVSHRPASGVDTAIEEITKKGGLLYDTKIVDICLKILKEDKTKLEFV